MRAACILRRHNDDAQMSFRREKEEKYLGGGRRCPEGKLRNQKDLEAKGKNFPNQPVREIARWDATGSPGKELV